MGFWIVLGIISVGIALFVIKVSGEEVGGDFGAGCLLFSIIALILFAMMAEYAVYGW